MIDTNFSMRIQWCAWHVFLWHKKTKTCLLSQEDMSTCDTRTCVFLLQEDMCLFWMFYMLILCFLVDIFSFVGFLKFSFLFHMTSFPLVSQEDMSSCDTRRRLPAPQEDMTSCVTRRHVFLRLAQEDMSCCDTGRHVFLCRKKTCAI